MKKLKSTFGNMVLSLGIITVVMGAILAYVNYATRDKIAQIKEQTLSDGIKAVILKDGGELTIQKIDTVNNMVVYATADNAGGYLGSAVKATVNGFGGALTVLVGFNAEGDILGYRILESQETPGLGAKAGEWFQQGNPGNIIGKNPVKNNLTVNKGSEPGEVNAITASTITSRAFLNAVNNAYQAFKGNHEADGTSGASQVKPAAAPSIQAQPVEQGTAPVAEPAQPQPSTDKK